MKMIFGQKHCKQTYKNAFLALKLYDLSLSDPCLPVFLSVTKGQKEIDVQWLVVHIFTPSSFKISLSQHMSISDVSQIMRRLVGITTSKFCLYIALKH